MRAKKEEAEKLWIKIRDWIRSATKNWDNYDEKYMKIKFNSDDDIIKMESKDELKEIDIKNRTFFYFDDIM